MTVSFQNIGPVHKGWITLEYITNSVLTYEPISKLMKKQAWTFLLIKKVISKCKGQTN